MEAPQLLIEAMEQVADEEIKATLHSIAVQAAIGALAEQAIRDRARVVTFEVRHGH